MSEIVVTRIVTVFRQWPLVGRWLAKSCLQTPGVEWIFVNDCPEDAPGPEIYRQLQACSTRIVACPRNLGPGEARNFGAQFARGQWLDFVDGDDLPLDFDLALCDPAVDLVNFAVAGHSTEAEFAAHRDLSEPITGTAYAHEPDQFAYPPQLSIDVRVAANLWKTTSFKTLHGFDGRFYMAEDNEILWRAGRLGMSVKKVLVCKQSYFYGPGQARDGLHRVAAKIHVFDRIAAECAPVHQERVGQRINELMRSAYWEQVTLLRARSSNRFFLIKEGLKLLAAGMKLALGAGKGP